MKSLNLSSEFKKMDAFEFHWFLRKLNRETNEKLLIIICTDDINHAKRLKAIKENTNYDKLTFEIEIQATIEEYQKELNIFASGIKWIQKH